ncbi:ComEA family DNA-binding protein [Halomonas campisalis]|uniref:ComEA family DNA-binding protein n=1 Tax=Billgrantia campisalis TaxID=74661 RepID=A0ABS9PB29_9GAMM|nr:ComEA family DNA-binding protein [Halomonas campisalis]MCG6658984.1 ComEA family DNA-binding protein [Halomonas campisalis]MDR5863706.1 ComEA family DNA-binding protein [Halomonas campisalis]
MKGTFKGASLGMILGLLLALSPLALAEELAPINVNTADAELLAELPGIGPTRAEAIIAERDANGGFESADDLIRVSGIGSATVDGLRDQVEF